MGQNWTHEQLTMMMMTVCSLILNGPGLKENSSGAPRSRRNLGVRQELVGRIAARSFPRGYERTWTTGGLRDGAGYLLVGV